MLKALSDDTRWNIVRQLLKSPSTIGQLTEKLSATQYNISKHVRILREAGIIETQRRGKHVECAVAESFRQKLKKDELDLGCCTFTFR